MELFAKIVKSWKLLTIFAKSFILDVWQGFEYGFGGSESTPRLAPFQKPVSHLDITEPF